AREDLAGQEVSAANSRHSRLSFCCSWWPHRLGLCYVVRLCLLDAFFWARRRSGLFSNCLESHVERRGDEEGHQRRPNNSPKELRTDTYGGQNPRAQKTRPTRGDKHKN